MKTYARTIILMSLLFCLLLIADLCLGNIRIPLADVWAALFHPQTHASIHTDIVLNFRLPKALTAIIAGSALSVSGLMMQTMFRNPLAGPDVLGVNSGASLGVALLVMLGSMGGIVFGSTSWSIILAAILGAFLVLILILIISRRMPDIVSLLIVGMMLGYIASSVVSLLQSLSNPESLKLFVVWTFGSLSAVSWQMMPVLGAIFIFGIFLAFLMCKEMDVLMLGESYAQTLGISLPRVRFMLILTTALLSGGITAFAGPISFVGITVPHIARGLVKDWSHRRLLPLCMLCGSSLLLVCDILSQMPVFNASFPINSITSLVGAPIIIWIMLKNRK
ncbi:MAG: iron ABC transporter permease [Bacteroidales bacterium]|nr:iron ABC transporter permease [Bacteroidales bacterium]MBO5916447.1 iron ABC transporter permease [Bacteroidales bacterium]MBO7231847.1 iron ABC transporter permease [Bacteroidales bacterium]